MSAKPNNARIDAVLDKTWEDHRLSRGERRALAHLLGQDPDVAAQTRRRAFERAKSFARDAELELVLDWLEAVNKALAARTTTPTRGQSEAHFAPREEVFARIVRALDATRERADLAVFTITDNRITNALLAAHQRGVALRIVSDNDKANDRGSDIERLAEAGVAVRVDRTEVHMHHKFAIFDTHLLLTGSYNWTRSANDENAENIVLVDDQALIAAFAEEFRYCWDKGQRY